MLNSQASASIGPLFARAGWVFFMPYRRGQGLSAAAGPYLMDQVAKARSQGGARAASVELTRLLSIEQLQDQLAALAWLESQPFVQRGRIAVAGNSFGGIETILGSAHAPYCAAVAASAASESWESAPELRQLLLEAAAHANAPLLLFQAENDFSLEPNKALLGVRQRVGKPVEAKLYPSYGSSARDGHSFAYKGASTWFPDVLKFVERSCAQ
jgi:dienelactone hydrolase